MANQQLAFEALQPPQPTLTVVKRLPELATSIVPQRVEWLCVYLPQLATEVLVQESSNPELLVVSTAKKGQAIVHNAALAAVQHGIYPGLKVPTAYTLCDSIDVRERNPQKEQHRLEELAACLYEFSSRVSIEPPNKLLMEIAASDSLFGGRTALLEQISTALKQQGHRIRTAISSTPTAALWLAQWQSHSHKNSTLRQQINSLPLNALQDAPTSKLQQLGCKNLGDILRLPRSGLARRLGPKLLQQLDRALGHQPDPRSNYRPPLLFDKTLELTAELNTLDQFWPGVETLLKQLEQFLVETNRCSRWLQLDLQHADAPTTEVPLRLLRASASANRFSPLLYGQLERISLAAPVRQIRLQLKQLQASRPVTNDSLNCEHADVENWLETLERLQLRLGSDRVMGVTLQNSHQPEAAWSTCSPNSKSDSSTVSTQRPNWLLKNPRKLSHIEQKSLKLLNKMERIAPAWWQSTESPRNYHIAEQPNGQRLWVYRCQQNWYCHGIFA